MDPQTNTQGKTADGYTDPVAVTKDRTLTRGTDFLYPMGEPRRAAIERTWSAPHAITGDSGKLYDNARRACKNAQIVFEQVLPPGRRLQQAVTDLENAALHIFAGIVDEGVPSSFSDRELASSHR